MPDNSENENSELEFDGELDVLKDEEQIREYLSERGVDQDQINDVLGALREGEIEMYEDPGEEEYISEFDDPEVVERIEELIEESETETTEEIEEERQHHRRR